MKRTLALRRETLATLSPEELGAVAAGDASGQTCVSCTVISVLTFCAQWCPYSFPNC